mmetsp:Transcript_93009/g.199470  ORF Transcript_93009/g.199470 Transcript_93009/m.199470 type:complete len:273 (+) Transcript_93009:54-872(+)
MAEIVNLRHENKRLHQESKAYKELVERLQTKVSELKCRLLDAETKHRRGSGGPYSRPKAETLIQAKPMKCSCRISEELEWFQMKDQQKLEDKENVILWDDIWMDWTAPGLPEAFLFKKHVVSQPACHLDVGQVDWSIWDALSGSAVKGKGRDVQKAATTQSISEVVATGGKEIPKVGLQVEDGQHRRYAAGRRMRPGHHARRLPLRHKFAESLAAHMLGDTGTKRKPMQSPVQPKPYREPKMEPPRNIIPKVLRVPIIQPSSRAFEHGLRIG